MERGQYHKAKRALDLAQQAVDLLVESGDRGPHFDRAVDALRAAQFALHDLIKDATTPEREIATLDASEPETPPIS